jgi:hypothetical protein
MENALREHTEDAQLFYHAGMIDHALGDTSAARTMLSRALAVNPYFHPTQPDQARAILASIGAPAAMTTLATGARRP